VPKKVDEFRSLYPAYTLMSYSGAPLLRLTKFGLEPVSVEATDHYKVMREFCDDPVVFVEAVVGE
jgi:predicted ATPase